MKCADSTYNLCTSMTPCRVVCGFALVAVLSVLRIFFFPVSQGPYAAVHGPVTALLSIRAAARLRLMITVAGLKAILGTVSLLGIGLVLSAWLSLLTAVPDPERVPDGSGTILRC